MTKKEFEKLTGYTIKYLDISNRSRETNSTMELSNGKVYYGDHFGGGYTKAQARAELFEQVLTQLKNENLGVRTLDDMTKFIALSIFIAIDLKDLNEQKEYIKGFTKYYNCSLKELYDRLKYFGHELQGGQNE